MDMRVVLENIYKHHFNLFVSIGVKYRLDKRAIEDMIHDAFTKAFAHHEEISRDEAA